MYVLLSIKVEVFGFPQTFSSTHLDQHNIICETFVLTSVYSPF